MSVLDKTIGQINAQLSTLIPAAKSALSGDAPFTVAEVRALSRRLAEMAPILTATEPAPQDPQITAELAKYKAHLRELQPILEQLRLNLVAKRSQLSSGQAQLQAVSNWATALSKTNDL
jgi:hypothetical protein